MLIERLASSNRWRSVSPAAKGTFALSGLIAVFAAGTPLAAALAALVLAAVTQAGAGIRLLAYLRVAAPALLFLAASSLPLAFSVNTGNDAGAFSLAVSPPGLHRVAEACARALGGLAALLFLALTTPLTDIIALLRRLRAPEMLLDITVLCYRTLFVFSACLQDIRTAQAARLGYAAPRLALRSLGQLVANLAAQVWQRSQALHLAALARNNDGPLRFLEPTYDHARRDTALAAAAGLALIALTLGVASAC